MLTTVQNFKTPFLQSKSRHLKSVCAGILIGSICISGCVSIPPSLFVLSPQSLTEKEQQSKKIESVDEKKMLQAASGVLQDLGFTIDKSETELGFINASKDRSASSKGQAAAALTLDIAAAVFGVYSNTYGNTDKAQKIQASLVIMPSLAEKKSVVRVKFQRIVWNRMDQVSHFETITDPALYQEFFDKLSKSLFLEEQKL